MGSKQVFLLLILSVIFGLGAVFLLNSGLKQIKSQPFRLKKLSVILLSWRRLKFPQVLSSKTKT